MATQTRYPSSNYSIGTGADGWIFSIAWTSGQSCYTTIDEVSVDDNDLITWYGTPGLGSVLAHSAEVDSVVYFGFSAFSIPAGATINSVTLYYRTSGYVVCNSPGMNGYGGIKVNGTDYWSSVDHSVSWANNSKQWTTNPNTGSAWTVDDVNGSGAHPLQYIQYYNDGGTDYWTDGKNSGGGPHNMFLSQLSIVVDYTATSTPTVTTSAVSSISYRTATGNGNVTSDGGATITERGVCWKTSTGPTTADSKATSAGTTGAYTPSMTGLVPHTHYYVRAYAINSAGTAYGSEVEFDTLDAPYSLGGDSGSVLQTRLSWGGII